MTSSVGMMTFPYMMEHMKHKSWLVVLPILKNMKVNGKDDIPYMKKKNKTMFETTNQKAMFETTNQYG